MKAAVIVPGWSAPPSGGRKALHQIAAVLHQNDVEAYTVGLPYEHDDCGDVTLRPDAFMGDENTAIIVPEGYERIDHYMHFIEDMPHGPVIVYIQSCNQMGAPQEWETHYWGLGETQRTIARARMGLSQDHQFEEVLPPIDTDFWCPDRTLDGSRRCMRGTIAYCPKRNGLILDRVARKCEARPIFRFSGANREEVRSILAQADIFMLASDAEGVSTMMCEAMAMECAIVTWPSGGLVDVVEHEESALIVKQNDVIGLEECVKSLQADPVKARGLGRNARSRVKELFSYDRFESSVLKAWSKVAE